jgi:hypothetical protein
VEPSEVVSLLLIVFFFFAAIFSPIIQQLRSESRQRKRAAARDRKRKVKEGTEGESEQRAETGEHREAGDQAKERWSLKRAGSELRELFRRDRGTDRRETDAYRDLLREDEPGARYRFTEGDREEPEKARTPSPGELERAYRTESTPSRKAPPTAGTGAAVPDRPVEVVRRTSPSRTISSIGDSTVGSSWSAAGIGQTAAGRGRRRPGGRGLARIQSLPPLQRGVIMAELLGKPKSLKEKPFD